MNCLLKKIPSFINQIKMKKKLMLSFSFIMIIPIGICIYLGLLMSKIMINQAQDNTANSVERVSTRLATTLNDICNMTSGIVNSSLLSDTIHATYHSDYEMVKALWENGDLSVYKRIYQDYVSEMHLYVDDINILNTGYLMKTPKTIKDTDWYTKAINGKTLPFWKIVENTNFVNKGNESLSLIRPAYDKNGTFGVLCIKIDSRFFKEILSQEAGLTMIISPNQEIVATSQPNDTLKYFEQTNFELRSESKLTVYKKDHSIIVSCPFHIQNTNGNFYVVSVLNENEVLKESKQAILTTSLIILIGIIICIFLAILLSKILTNRLNKLSNIMHKIANGDLGLPCVMEGADEIADLSKDLDSMVKSINKLINEVYEINLQKQKLANTQKDIKLKMLSTQLHPHFLFNTLESIRMKAVVNGQDDISQIMKRLSDLLRQSLYMGEQPIWVCEELKLCENYLKIQEFRFEGRIQYNINVLSDISKIKILPFIIQPLVENCLKHGLENSITSSGFVNITLFVENNHLIIKVIDNGDGIPSQDLKNLKHQIESQQFICSNHHIGITNINQRLNLFYGNSFSMDISSQKDKGTIITLIVPIDEN